ncbi:MAG: DUF4194 domain-containing protein [Acidimicrobiales bacterium]|jgi:hypothetical protein
MDTPLDVPNAPTDLSLVLVHLMKGPLYRDVHERYWGLLLGLRNQVGDYVSVLGLNVVVDEAEGYAYLRSQFVDQDAIEFPRLVARHALPFKVSVFLALLRKRLAEFDASNSDVRLVLSRDQIIELLRLFMPDSTNEARLVDNIDTTVKRVCELGFLHPLRGEQDRYEVRRILKAYIDGQWLSEFEARLDEYLADLDASKESA